MEEKYISVLLLFSKNAKGGGRAVKMCRCLIPCRDSIKALKYHTKCKLS